MQTDTINCPCGTGNDYCDCCQKAHNAPPFIATAEELMRSRYTAFTMANGPYLIETHHSATRHNVDESDIVNWAKSVQWLRLEIIGSTDGQAADEKGTVEFKAHFKEKNKARFIHENSYFEKEYGVWKYKSIL